MRNKIKREKEGGEIKKGQRREKIKRGKAKRKQQHGKEGEKKEKREGESRLEVETEELIGSIFFFLFFNTLKMLLSLERLDCEKIC